MWVRAKRWRQGRAFPLSLELTLGYELGNVTAARLVEAEAGSSSSRQKAALWVQRPTGSEDREPSLPVSGKAWKWSIILCLRDILVPTHLAQDRTLLSPRGLYHDRKVIGHRRRCQQRVNMVWPLALNNTDDSQGRGINQVWACQMFGVSCRLPK